MGAWNAFIMAMYPPGEEQKAAGALTQFWLSLRQDMVYEDWTFGLMEGIFFRSGLYNAEPLADTLKGLAKNYDHEFQRKISIALTDLNSGTFTHTNTQR